MKDIYKKFFSDDMLSAENTRETEEYIVNRFVIPVFKQQLDEWKDEPEEELYIFRESSLPINLTDVTGCGYDSENQRFVQIADSDINSNIHRIFINIYFWRKDFVVHFRRNALKDLETVEEMSESEREEYVDSLKSDDIRIDINFGHFHFLPLRDKMKSVLNPLCSAIRDIPNLYSKYRNYTDYSYEYIRELHSVYQMRDSGYNYSPQTEMYEKYLDYLNGDEMIFRLNRLEKFLKEHSDEYKDCLFSDELRKKICDRIYNYHLLNDELKDFLIYLTDDNLVQTLKTELKTEKEILKIYHDVVFFKMIYLVRHYLRRLVKRYDTNAAVLTKFLFLPNVHKKDVYKSFDELKEIDDKLSFLVRDDMKTLREIYDRYIERIDDLIKQNIA